MLDLLLGTMMMIKGRLLLIVNRFGRKKPHLGQILMVLAIGLNRGRPITLNVGLSLATPKGTSLRDIASFELSRVKIHQHV